MKYYTIQNNNILITDRKEALTRFYDNVLPLPEDYEVGKYISIDNVLAINPNYEEQKQKEEKERIGKLTMTPLDFINFLQQCGLTLEQIDAYLQSNLNVKMQLTYCSDVYCGVACSLMPVAIGEITITEEMVIQAFKVKNNIAS